MSIVPARTDETGDGRPGRHSFGFVCITCAAGFAAAFLFSAFPALDLLVSGLFHLGERTFLFSEPSFGAVLRETLQWLFRLICAGVIVGFVALAFFNRRLFGLGLAAWIYIALTAAIGPGVVANLGFKEHWDRARPVHITQFGGDKQFTPAMLRADQCESNCAFISGEASNYYALGFAFAFLFGTGAYRRAWFAGAIAAGSVAGLIRIGSGDRKSVV